MRRAGGERGQVLPLVVMALVALLGIGAFAIDVGYAYYAKRQLQSATDAAALAGAQDLPTAATAIATATSYAAANTPANLSNFTFSYQTRCTNTAVLATGCDPAVNPNALQVTGTASTPTWFAGLFGIDHFDISAHANACSPCSASPVDIVIAIDRTGSMCTPRGPGGECTDLDNAKDGVRTMLSMMNPPYAQIGMVAFPPVESTASDPCSTPYNSIGGNGYDGYDSPTRGYLTDTINGNYKSAGVLNPSSGLYQHTVDGPSTSCIQAGGNTSYSEALRQAQAELNAHGRPNVPDFIVFLTDGEANIGSVYGPSTAYPQGNADDQQPCQTAIDLANSYKVQGTTIYSIGYALGGNVNCTAGGFRMRDASNQWVACTLPTAGCYHYASPTAESPALTSYNTLSQIASPGNFYNQPAAAELDTIFAAIATDIAQGSSRLIDDNF
jgi:Putative Flp pilus-assembly TadE/G-like